MPKRNPNQITGVEPPQTMYVYWNDDVEDGWFDAAETIEAAATQGETRLVGEYTLVKLHEVSLVVSNNVIVKDAKKKKRAAK